MGASTAIERGSNRMMRRIKQFLCSEDGPTTVEYAVMLSLILAVCLTAIMSVGENVSSSFDDSQAELNTHFDTVFE